MDAARGMVIALIVLQGELQEFYPKPDIVSIHSISVLPAQAEAPPKPLVLRSMLKVDNQCIDSGGVTHWVYPRPHHK